MKETLKLFAVFLKIGCFAFGGGLALLPALKRELAEKRDWIDSDVLVDLFALAQTLPGLVAINVTGFIGYRIRGVKGAILAALGILLPPIIIITLIAAFLQTFADLPLVAKAFRGLNIAVVVLIAQALFVMGKRGLVDKVTAAVFFLALAVYAVFSINPVFLVLGGILLGLLLRRGTVE